MPVPVTTSAGSNVCQLVVVDTRLDQEDAHRYQGEPGGENPAGADAVREASRDRGDEHQHQRHGIMVSPASSGVMPSALEEDRHGKEDSEQAERYGEADDVGDPEVADAEELELDHRIGDAPLPPDEDDKDRGADEQQSKRLRAGPAELGTLDQRVDQGEDRRGGEDDTAPVELAGRQGIARFGNDRQSGEDGDDPTGILIRKTHSHG